jgi:hypothetical protein
MEAYIALAMLVGSAFFMIGVMLYVSRRDDKRLGLIK